MPEVFIQVPAEKVYAAMCDLTRHAAWAPDDIAIEAKQDSPPQVGHTYTSSKGGNAPDQVTITAMSGNQTLRFRTVMPNKWEFAFEMTVSPQGEGSRVTRSARIAKIPLFMAPFRLVVAVLGPKLDQKFLNGMKADLESGAGD